MIRDERLQHPSKSTMPAHNTHKVSQIGRSLAKKGPRRQLKTPAVCDKIARGRGQFTSPAVRDKYAKGTLNILQLNVQGLQRKTTEVKEMLDTYEIHVALLQETILPSKEEVNVSGYTKFKCKCKKCQGIMSLIRNDVEATVTNKTNGDIDHQFTQVWPKGKRNLKYTVHNIYYPNKSSTKLPETIPTQRKTIIAGDFNAHLPSLGYPDYNFRGHEVEDLVNGSNLLMLQNKETPPSFYSRTHGTTSRPDLTFVSADILDNTDLEVLDDVGSDHRPILTKITLPQAKTHVPNKTAWNYTRAQWQKFSNITDEEYTKINQNTTIELFSHGIEKATLSSSKSCIPRGRRKKYKKHWTPELAEAVSQRRRARKIVEDNAKSTVKDKEEIVKDKTQYNRLTAKVRYLTKKGKSKAFKAACSDLDLKKQGHKAWGLLSNLEGSKRKENPQPLKDEKENIITGKKKAKLLNKMFSSITKGYKRKQLDKALLKIMNSKKGSKHAAAFVDPFTSQELDRAIAKLQLRKTPGPDGITNEMIKHLGPRAKQVLLKFINKTWEEGQLPSRWRTAIITPILKKGKDPSSPKSYRPISLTSCLGKLAEKMVNTRLYYWLEKNKVLDNNQAGFRRGCRTGDPLFRLVQDVIDGFQVGKSTTAVFIDLQQAYDRVWRKGLLLKLFKTGVQGKMLKWIQGFLTNRTIATKCDGATSSKRTLEEGLPQGSALSCTLFLVYINDLTKHLGVSAALFADDLVIWTTDKYPILSRTKLNRALLNISVFCKLWKLKVNAQKTVYTIFSRSYKAAQRTFTLKIDGHTLEKEQSPVYLGVTLDRQMNMADHIKKIKEQATKRLNLIKRLASTKWGADKLTLRQLYMGYVRSVMDNNLPLQSIASKSNTATLDRTQNQALRLICGGMRTTPTAACEIEANIEPMDHRRNRALIESVERYRRQEEDHPNRRTVDNWEEVKRLKQTSLMDKAKDLEEKQNLPLNRKLETKCPFPPPWQDLRQPTIKTSLLDKSVNKQTVPTILKACALETIDSYPPSAVKIYTDGSAFRATKLAGYGVFVKYPDGSTETLSEACGKNSSNYEAEINAITAAVELLHQQFELKEKDPLDIVIFSDSSSALDALKMPPYPHPDLGKAAYAIHNLLTSYNIQLTLQWIPGHNEIAGNELADELAKQGTRKQQEDNPCTMATAKNILKNQSKEEWLNEWAIGKTGRAMFAERSKPKKTDPINKLHRPDQSLIFQFRTGHAGVNMHLNRINPLHGPHCRHCPHAYETTSHILFECPGLDRKRDKLLPPKPDIHNTLYGPLKQLRLTANFIRLALADKSE